MRTATAFLVLVVALLGGVGSPAHALQSDDALWVEDAISGLAYKMALLQQSVGFTPDPTATALTSWVSSGTDLDTVEFAPAIAIADDNNRFLLADAEDQGWPLSPAVIAALSAADGAPSDTDGFLDPGPYLDAITDLIIRAGAAPTEDRLPGEHLVIMNMIEDFETSATVDLDTFTDFVAPAPATSPTVTEQSAPAESGSLASMLLIGGTILFVTCGAFSFGRRRLGRRAQTLTPNAAVQLPDRRRLKADMSNLGDEEAIGIVMIDVDEFRAYVERNGSEVGDKVLDRVVAEIQMTVRAGDAVYYHGGHAFCLLLRDCDQDAAMQAVERIRATVEQLSVHGLDEQPFASITVSAGVAFGEGADAALLAEQAGAALYGAKTAGCNTVVRHDEPGPPQKLEPAQ